MQLNETRLRTRKPFVGLGGTGNTITIERQADRIICRLSGWTYALVLSALLIFGPGLLMLLWLRPVGTIDLAKQPVFLAALILLIPLISCVLFVSFLLQQHRFEVVPALGIIVFYKRVWGASDFSVPFSSIERLEIVEEWYRPSRGAPTKNYVLCARCLDGSDVDLCLSTKEALIRSLQTEIEQLT